MFYPTLRRRLLLKNRRRHFFNQVEATLSSFDKVVIVMLIIILSNNVIINHLVSINVKLVVSTPIRRKGPKKLNDNKNKSHRQQQI